MKRGWCELCEQQYTTDELESNDGEQSRNCWVSVKRILLDYLCDKSPYYFLRGWMLGCRRSSPRERERGKPLSADRQDISKVRVRLSYQEQSPSHLRVLVTQIPFQPQTSKQIYLKWHCPKKRYSTRETNRNQAKRSYSSFHELGTKGVDDGNKLRTVNPASKKRIKRRWWSEQRRKPRKTLISGLNQKTSRHEWKYIVRIRHK